MICVLTGKFSDNITYNYQNSLPYSDQGVNLVEVQGGLHRGKKKTPYHNCTCM